MELDLCLASRLHRRRRSECRRRGQMLIVVVHGVNTRSPELPDDIRMYIERYLALSNTSEQLHITYTYWGDLGGAFRFGGRSRPRTRYRSQGMAGDANIGPLSEFSDLVAEF